WSATSTTRVSSARCSASRASSSRPTISPAGWRIDAPQSAPVRARRARAAGRAERVEGGLARPVVVDEVGVQEEEPGDVGAALQPVDRAADAVLAGRGVEVRLVGGPAWTPEWPHRGA